VGSAVVETDPVIFDPNEQLGVAFLTAGVRQLTKPERGDSKHLTWGQRFLVSQVATLECVQVELWRQFRHLE
jgi:hypothetical protein